MLRLDKVIKPWKEAAALTDHINLYGFWNETIFLTKSGDLGMVLRVPGVDYESLDHAEQEYAVKRLEAALNDIGITKLPHFLVNRLVAEKRVVVLLDEWSASEIGIYGVYVSRKYVPPVMRAFIDFLAKEMKKAA